MDQQATFRALLLYPFCAACEARASNGHHIIQKGSPHFGDDLVENIVGLCGTGTTGCHGAIHGTPYVVCAKCGMAEHGYGFPSEDAFIPERRDAAWVAIRVGLTIRTRRPEIVAYVKRKLGVSAGAAYLTRFYPGWDAKDAL